MSVISRGNTNTVCDSEPQSRTEWICQETVLDKANIISLLLAVAEYNPRCGINGRPVVEGWIARHTFSCTLIQLCAVCECMVLVTSESA